MIAPVKTKTVRCAVYTRKSTEEGLEQDVQLPGRPAGGLRGLRHQPEGRGLGLPARPLRRRRVHRRQPRAPGPGSAPSRHRGRPGRLRGRLQGRPPVPVPARLLPPGGGVRRPRRVLRLGHPADQHGGLDRPADAEHPAQLRPVRARDHRRPDPRQDVGRPASREMDRRPARARLRHRPRRRPAGGQRGRSAHGPGDVLPLSDPPLALEGRRRAAAPRLDDQVLDHQEGQGPHRRAVLEVDPGPAPGQRRLRRDASPTRDRSSPASTRASSPSDCSTRSRRSWRAT